MATLFPACVPFRRRPSGQGVDATPLTALALPSLAPRIATPPYDRDLQPGAALRTSFGLVMEALVRRRERGIPPSTVVSCDNVRHNGELARNSYVVFAALRDAELEGVGAPPLEDAGVQLVDDVVPYELMKLRLLDAGHQVLAQTG